MKDFLLNRINSDSLITLLSQVPVALAMLMGEEMIVEIANPQILHLWGKSEAIIGLPILEALPEIKNQAFSSILKEVYTTGTPYKGNSELAIIEKNGVLVDSYFDFVYSPILNNGRITGVSIVATEVTEKVLAEKKLQDRELGFKELMEISDYSTAIYFGEDLIIDFANGQMLKTWGKDSSVIGMKLEDALPELQNQPFLNILKNIFKTGVSYTAKEDKVDFLVDGVLKTFYYNFSYKPLYDQQGKIYAILNVAVDVTELVNAKKLSQAKEEEYRNLAEAMPQMVWRTDAEGNVEYCNEQMLNLLTPEEKRGQYFSFIKIIHPDDVPKLYKNWREAHINQKGFEIEYRIFDAVKQEYRWFLTRALPVLKNGEVFKWIGTSTDINEFKNLVNQKDTFLGIASHELKTPLTSLKLYAQVLERMLKKTGDEKNAEFAKKMDFQVVKLTSLIEDLLDVTKINSGKIHLNQDAFDLEKLVLESAEEMQMNTMHKINIHTKNVGMVFADRERISQVITNLISNAVKYSPDADEIIIHLNTDGKYATFTVKDFGIGMPEDKKDRVFEQYYRVSGDEQSTFSGLGLGLYIAAQIVERSNGKIWVESTVGEGSTFCFSLPVVDLKNE